MGPNKNDSTVKQTIVNKTINKNTLDVISEQVTNAATSTLMESVQKSAASSVQTAGLNIAGLSASGQGSEISGLNINIDQQSTITLDVLSKSLQNNEINTALATAIVQNVESTISNEQLAALESSANASQMNGLSFSSGSNASKAINDMTNITDNETTRKFKNLVSNNIVQKAASVDYKTCFASQANNALINVGNITAINGGRIGNVNIGIKQVSNVINKCIMETIQGTAVISSIATDMGLTIKDDTKNVQSASGKATASASQVNDIFGGYGYLVSISCSCVLLVGIILILVWKFGGFGKKLIETAGQEINKYMPPSGQVQNMYSDIMKIAQQIAK